MEFTITLQTHTNQHKQQSLNGRDKYCKKEDLKCM